MPGTDPTALSDGHPWDLTDWKKFGPVDARNKFGVGAVSWMSTDGRLDRESADWALRLRANKKNKGRMVSNDVKNDRLMFLAASRVAYRLPGSP